jgi:predicted kinase
MELGRLQGVIFDATNARRRHRREVLALGRQIGFSTIIGIWFDVPLYLCLQRNRHRSRQVPEEVILRMARQLQGAPPSLSEDLDCLIQMH